MGACQVHSYRPIDKIDVWWQTPVVRNYIIVHQSLRLRYVGLADVFTGNEKFIIYIDFVY